MSNNTIVGEDLDLKVDLCLMSPILMIYLLLL